MDYHIQHACITYIACRLITGKSPAFLYDLETSEEMEMAGVLDLDFLQEFDEKHQGLPPRLCQQLHLPVHRRQRLCTQHLHQ